MMKKLVLIVALFFTPYNAFSDFIDTKWKVVGFSGEAWFADPRLTLGKTQEFNRGYAEGVFYSCNFAGQSATYNVYTTEKFLANKEFEKFKKLNIKFDSNKIFVHRITCNGKKGSDRRLMYPFVTQDNSNKGYYLFEGAIYHLEYDYMKD